MQSFEILMIGIVLVLLVIAVGLVIWAGSRPKVRTSSERSQRIALGLSLGLAVGGGIGIVLGSLLFDSMSLGITLGAGGGMVIGLALGSLPQEKHEREE